MTFLHLLQPAKNCLMKLDNFFFQYKQFDPLRCLFLLFTESSSLVRSGTTFKKSHTRSASSMVILFTKKLKLLNKSEKGRGFASVFEATYRIFTSTLIKDIWHQFLIILLSFPFFSINKLMMACFCEFKSSPNSKAQLDY